MCCMLTAMPDMQAQTAEDKAECVEQAVERIRSTLDWTSEQNVLTPTQMHCWDHLVCHFCCVSCPKHTGPKLPCVLLTALLHATKS